MKNSQINLLIAEDEPFQQEILLLNLKAFDFVHVVDLVKNGDELIQKATTDSKIDALLLDINLGKGRGGLESYASLRFRGKDIPAVLVTGMIPEASYTYDLGIIDIVEKPFTSFRFRQAMEKLGKYIDYQKFIRNGGLYIPVFDQDIEQLFPSDVLFIESLNRTIYVHTKNRFVETKIPLRVYCQYLESSNFYLTHRSFLVNLEQIHSIEGNVIHFANDERTALITEDKLQEFTAYWHNVLKNKGKS